MKKIWGMVTILGMTVCLLAGCGNDKKAAQDGSISAENETAMENGTGSGSVISIGDSYYYDLLSSENGDIYALTDGEAENGEKPVFVWKSSDQGENWEDEMQLPDTLPEDSYLMAGTLQESKDGLEAFVIVSDPEDSESDAGGCHLMRVTEKKSEELNTGDLFTKIGGYAWNISMVNDHVVSVAGTEQCVLYDTEQQKPLKTLSYDYCSAGFFSVKDQFVVYGNEIKYCLNKETLEEQEPEAGLKKFVEEMIVKCLHR